MAYPEKVTDLTPDQLVSDPVVFIDYDLLPGLPAEAQEALLKAVSIFESFSASPLPREQAVAYRRPLTDSEADKVLKIAQDDWVRLSEQYDRARQDSSQFTPLALSEINGWALRENKRQIVSNRARL
nr:MAG TPA: Protein of unknown function (DUF1595) [Caudoviricetes sp.]